MYALKAGQVMGWQVTTGAAQTPAELVGPLPLALQVRVAVPV